MPSHDSLLEHIETEREWMDMELEVLENDGIALGWKSEYLHRERLGLGAEAHRLLADPEEPGPPTAPHEGGFAASWKNYVRQVLRRGHWFFFQQKPETLFYVAENKVLGGREERAVDEAAERKLAVAFFERLGNTGVVRPVDRSSKGLKHQLLTLAELLVNVGLADLPPDPSRTSAQTELLLEAKYLDLELRCHSGWPAPLAKDLHSFVLEGHENAEEALVDHSAPGDLTKMALARTLQRNDFLQPRETLKAAWASKLDTLKARAGTLLPPADPREPRGALGAEAGRARGRGCGRGR